jgi:hypothetical protein
MAEEKYKGIKLPALRKVAKEKGLKDYEDLERKELVELLEKSDDGPDDEEAVKEDEVEEDDKEEDDEVEAPEKQVGITEGNIPVGSKAEKMKERLALQPEVRIMIPLEGKEKRGSTFPVTLNGYRLNIQKGTYVKVPEQVANVVMESQKQTVAAADELKRVEDGKPMKVDGSDLKDPLN